MKYKQNLKNISVTEFKKCVKLKVKNIYIIEAGIIILVNFWYILISF